MGYKCPACARHHDVATSSRPRSSAGPLGRLARRANDAGRGSAARSTTTPVTLATGARATLVAVGAALLGGLLLAPVLEGGFFFLLSAGAVGWGVARAVYWATTGADSPYIRATALTAAGFSVALALIAVGQGPVPAGLLLLAYPAAVYGGWVVVRSR